jgi:hypothetical protein
VEFWILDGLKTENGFLEIFLSVGFEPGILQKETERTKAEAISAIC